MHSVKFEFLGPDEIRATWGNWENGKPNHEGVYRVVRRK